MCAARLLRCSSPFFRSLEKLGSVQWPLRQASVKGGAHVRTYKAVIFDMGGVLLPSPYKNAAELELRHAVPVGTIAQAMRLGDKSSAWKRFITGEMSAAEFPDAFGKECSEIAGCSVPVDLFLAELMTGHMAQQLPAMTEAIQCIRAEGLKTAVLSNNFFLHDGQTFLPVDRSQFSVVVESCIEGMCKPDPRIYRLCAERLGVLPEESVFLDDVGQNVTAAQQLGFRAIKVGDPGAAIGELQGTLGFPLSGFVPGTRAVRPEMALPLQQLGQHLQEVLSPESPGAPTFLAGQPLGVRQFSHGQSNPTYLVTAGGRRLVLRKKPPGALLPSAHAVEREFRVLKALSSAGVPVPKVMALCEDPSVIGTPFFLMEYCPGRIFHDPSLPGMDRQERREVYEAMVRVLCRIHSVDIKAVGLEDYGKSGSYVARQVQTWTKQYRASETRRIPAMERLMEWLPRHLPRSERTAVVHGDFRLDNLIFHPEKPEVLAVLDWELSTLGDPISDLAYSCLAHFLPSGFPVLKGISQCDLAELGIPSAEEIFSLYSSHMGLERLDSWNTYMAFSLFRVAAILQGVYKRHLKGQASSADAASTGELAEQMAELAWDFAVKEGFRIFKSVPVGNPGAGPRRAFGSCSSSRPAPGQLIISPEGLPPPVQELYGRLQGFISARILPVEQELRDHQVSEKRWTTHPVVEQLKEAARAAGLWNLFIPLELDPLAQFGVGLTNLQYAHLCELMGRSLYAPEVFNCSAPDTGNMEVLIRYGTQRHQEEWLTPLLSGTIRSCFAMTEPQVASSDATNIEASIIEDEDYYILNGHKWWTSGALNPSCKLCVFMGKTDPSAPKHKQQSMILVPMDTPGVRVVRPLSVYGGEDAPGGHAELVFENVRVPRSSLLLGPGRGFEIAQGRLGPGRVHHCMRLVGHAERALELMKERVKTRVAFGKPLAEQGTILADIGLSRLEIEQARLLVLKTAHLMDTVGNKVAAPEIAMIKAVVPSMAQKVIDRAIQAFGAAGLSNDYPLALFFSWARALRLADGPDEVHRATVAKMELKR
ncbi:acyl-CoA dehydrogenase family member 10 isoform X1 [Lepisosteus oculatus]|uniref:acyl-CoA dehydrogenase family member 10 isoform X1 n=1 Tax=Lepisosteus oculatus TaxID=7918 RepID=UPI0035F50BC2